MLNSNSKFRPLKKFQAYVSHSLVTTRKRQAGRSFLDEKTTTSVLLDLLVQGNPTDNVRTDCCDPLPHWTKMQ